MPLGAAHWTIHVKSSMPRSATARLPRYGALWAYDYEGMHSCQGSEDGLTHMSGVGSLSFTSARSAAMWFAGVAPSREKMAARDSGQLASCRTRRCSQIPLHVLKAFTASRICRGTARLLSLVLKGTGIPLILAKLCPTLIDKGICKLPPTARPTLLDYAL